MRIDGLELVWAGADRRAVERRASKVLEPAEPTEKVLRKNADRGAAGEERRRCLLQLDDHGTLVRRLDGHASQPSATAGSPLKSGSDRLLTVKATSAEVTGWPSCQAEIRRSLNV